MVCTVTYQRQCEERIMLQIEKGEKERGRREENGERREERRCEEEGRQGLGNQMGRGERREERREKREE